MSWLDGIQQANPSCVSRLPKIEAHEHMVVLLYQAIRRSDMGLERVLGRIGAPLHSRARPHEDPDGSPSALNGLGTLAGCSRALSDYTLSQAAGPSGMQY